MNGQEKDDEIASGLYTAEYWEYDSRLSRRWNLDPVDQVSISNYATFRNDPIRYADPNGAEAEDKRLFDRKSGKQVGYEKDLNGTDYITDEYGHFTDDGKGFISEVTVKPQDRDAVAQNAQRIDNSRASSRAMSHSMDQFSKGLLFGSFAIAAAPLLPYALPAVAEGGVGSFLSGAALRTSIDAAAQMAVNNGDVSKLDVGDALMSGFLTPGGSAILGGGIDFKPFAEANQLRVMGINKGIGEGVFDAAGKYVFGRSGPIGKQFGKLGGEFTKLTGSPLAPLISAPFNMGGKLITKQAKNAIFN
jgi:RHS repeat-associated protein